MNAVQPQRRFDPAVLEQVFSACFLHSERTLLVGGAPEPVYRPAASDHQPHLLYYREDYFASALHEVAHWCIAGPARRRLHDFGYWYAPEGRDAQQQRAFESVEVKPQALEYLFSVACGYDFKVSVDNLDPVTGQIPDTRDFRKALVAEIRRRQHAGLPPRAARFFEALANRYATGVTLQALPSAREIHPW